MTWKTFHTRGEILRTVESVANERLDGRLPMDVEGVREKFEDELDLVGALQLRWHTRLAGHIEHTFSQQPLSLEGAVVSAWLGAADDMPGVRLILDHYRAEPVDDRMARAMAKALAKEHILLAVMAGQSNGGDDERSIPVGRRIEEKARELYRPAAPVETVRPSLLDRLRAALAA